jgi:hypothetical protein
MGLPGSGKTTLARALAPKLGAVLFNADEVRSNINKDLGFSIEDRNEQARRMSWLCDRVCDAGGVAIADFVCPTHDTREAFGEAFVIWVDRIREGRFEDTNKLFVPPERYDIRVPSECSAEEWAGRICTAFRKSQSLQAPCLRERIAAIKDAIIAFANDQRSNVLGREIPPLLMWTALYSLIVIVRASSDAPEFRELDALQQIVFTLVAMFWGGAFAANICMFCSLALDYLLIEPALSIGAKDEVGMISLLVGTLLSMVIGLATSTAFKTWIAGLRERQAA